MAEVEVFKIDIQPVVSELAKLGSELEKARAKYQETKNSQTEYSEDAIRAKAEVNVLSKEFNALTNVLTNQQKGLGELKKATEANIDITNIQNNTIETNRKLYNALYNQQLRNPSQEVAKQVKALSDTLKDQEKALGDTRRNVGNYEGALKNAVSEIKIFGVSLGSLNTTFNTYKAALGDAKVQLAAYITGQKAADGATKLSILSTGGLSAAMGVLRLALIATGVGAIVVLFGSLIAAFASTEKGADLLEDALANVTGVFKALFGEAQKIGTELINVFSNPKKAITDLVDFLKNNLINRLQGFKVVLDGILERDPKKLANGIAQIGTGVTNLSDKIQNAAKNTSKFIGDAAKKGQDVVKIQRELEDLEGAIAKRRAQNASRETELLIIAKKASSTAKERKAATDEILKNTANLQKLEEDIVSKKIQALKISQSQNITDRKGNKELQDLEAELIQVRDAGKDKQLSLIKLLNKEEKGAIEENKKAREKQKADEQKYADNLKALSEQFILDDRQRLIKSYDDKKATITAKSQEEIDLIKAIEDQKKLAVEKFDQDAEKKRQENQKKIESEIIANNAKAFNDKIAFNQKQLELELGAVDLSVGTEKEKERRKAEIQLTALEEQLRLTKEFLGPDGKGTNEQLQGIKVIEQAIAKAKENLKSKEGDATLGEALGINEEATKEAQNALSEISKAVEAVSGIINMVYETRLNNIDNTKNAEIDAINQSTASEEEKAIKIQKAERDAANAKYQIQLKQFQANKATSIIQTIINTAQAVIAQFANPVPFAGAILSALAAATGAAQIAVIASQPAPPKPSFATGVIGLEGAGTATSDSIDAKLSRGESVITARATERFAPILAQMELAVGNRPNFQMGNKRFATGFIPTGDGGYSTRNAGSDLMARNATEKAMMQAVSAMPAQKLVLEEFRNFETNVDKSVAISEL